jgi:hypothetical protein
MSVNVGSKITAANYNTLQSRIANVLGTGFEGSGYGQVLVSSTVDADTLITANHMELLRTDLNRICVHQTGSLSNLSEVQEGDKIGANEIDDDPTKGFYAYVSLMNILEANANLADIKKLLASSIDYGYYYIREINPSEVKIIHIDSPDTAALLIGKPTEVKIKYPGSNTKQTTVRVSLEESKIGARYIDVDIRNTSSGIDKPSIKININ